MDGSYKKTGTVAVPVDEGVVKYANEDAISDKLKQLLG